MGLTDKMEFKCSENSDGSVTYTVEARDTPPFRDEEHAPLDGIDAPQLILSGYYDGVSQLYAHLKSFIEEESENETVEIDSIANRLDNGNGNIYATIDSIASWVRDNIRYVGIEHGDYGIKPAKASKVLSDRFGDCKGSANLIKAMLLSLRIDSRLAWIGTKGSVNHRWDEITSISAGNHVIATAMLSDTIIFIDGTAAGYPTDALPPTIKGQQALIEDGDSYILAVVPDHGHKNDCDSTKTIMAIEGENLTGHTCHKLTGAMKGMFTGMYRTANPIMQEKLARHLLTAPKKNVRCENLSVSTPTSSSKSITLSADVTEYGSARKIGSKIYIDLRPLRDILSFTVDTENRYRGVSIPHPYRYAAHYELKLPEGHTAVSLPENKTIDTPWHEGKISYSLSGDTVVCEAELSTFRTNASIDELHEWNNAIRSIRKYSETPIVLSLTD